MLVSTNNGSVTSASNSYNRVQSSQYAFWQDPQASLPFLDDKANGILNDILSKKTPHEAFLVKATMMIDMQHPISADKKGNVFRGDIHDFKTSAPDVQKRLNSYAKSLQNSHKGLPDELGLTQIVQKLAEQYTVKIAPAQKQSTEETKSKNLEQFYNKEVQQKAESTKVSLEKTIPEHASRYETLMKMNFDNMNEVERAEFSHLSANRPLEFLSDEANKALAKSLEGKSDEEKGQIKAIISLEFTTSIKMDRSGNIVHGARDFSQKNHDEVVSKLNKFIDDFYKGGGVDTIGTMDVLKDFLALYTKDENTQKVPNVTLKDLLEKQNV